MLYSLCDSVDPDHMVGSQSAKMYGNQTSLKRKRLE